MNPSAPPAVLTPVKQALLKIDALRREVHDLPRSAGEPIAVVGIGCRLPGGADSAEQAWQMLAAGTDAVREVPADRWTDAVYDPQPGDPDRSDSRHGAFLDDVDRFDAAFFGISGREANRIDPQQRLLLECSWQAVEEARFTREDLKGSRTGVFIGSRLDDYARVSEAAADVPQSHAQTSLGTARSIVAGRISYVFGLHGPTLQLDTACSSSLTATHLACQSLRSGECDLALAGGVNLMLAPEVTIGLCELQALSPDGRCRTFDAGANGYVRGEGCGVVALMRLSDAQAQRRPIRALIRGSAVNHDGRSNGLTAPNGRAQRDVISAALAHAGVAPAEVDYVEAHGTATLLGDPIELRALHEVYCKDIARPQDLHVGSIKTNIGHLEGAAGVAGLIKVVCALQKGELPAHLNLRKPTPHADWAGNRIKVADRHMAWPSGRPGRRVAGVSSFGISGTNAHVILEAYLEDDAHAGGWLGMPQEPDAEPQIFPFSGHTPATLQLVLADCAGQVHLQPGIVLADLAHSLRMGRDTQRYRSAVVADTAPQLMTQLDLARQMPPAGAPGGANGKLAFLFTGQGSQYAGMAQRLYEAYIPFRHVIDECDGYFDSHGEHSLVDVLWGDQQALVHDMRYMQPATFAVECALARLWAHWGLTPDALMGHSVGEYAAACTAGVFSLADGMRLVAVRGRMLDLLTPPGRMVAVSASVGVLSPYLAAHAGRIALASDNAPGSTVISGDPAAVDALVKQLQDDGIEIRVLAIPRAFHSPLVEPMLESLRRVAESVTYREPRILLVSNVSGAFETARFCSPGYWVEHMRRAVQFRAGVDTLCEAGVGICIEVGPGKVLAGLARACAEARNPAHALHCFHSFDARSDERAQLLQALAGVYGLGCKVDWSAFERSRAGIEPRRRIALPPNPLEPRSYGVGTRVLAEPGRRLAAAPRPASNLGLLGSELMLPAMPERRFESRVSLEAHPQLAGHAVHGRVVFPAAAFLHMALAAAWHTTRSGTQRQPLELLDVSFDRQLNLEDGDVTCMGTVVGDGDGALGRRLCIYARPVDAQAQASAWTSHCSARLAPVEARPDGPSLAQFHVQCTEAVPVERFYDRLHAWGLHYSGPFRSIRSLVRAQGQALGRIELTTAPKPLPHGAIDAALLDNCFQIVAAALPDCDEASLHLPVGLQSLRSKPLGSATALWCAVAIRAYKPLLTADLWVFDSSGDCVAEMAQLQLTRVPAQLVHATPQDLAASLFGLDWQPLPAGDAADSAWARADYLLVGHGSALEPLLQAQLGRAGMAGWGLPSLAGGVAIPATDEGVDADGEVLRAELATYAARPAAAPQQVLLYLWPQDPAGDEPRAVEAAYQRFAGFWRALCATDWAARSVAVCLVTQAGQCVPGLDRRVVPAQAAAWGLARSLMHESTDHRVLLVDVPAADAASAGGVLNAIRLALPCDESQIAVRGEALYAPRMVRRVPPAAALSGSPSAFATGTYLVTGGRGAIGTRVTEWLIGKAAPRVVSASRQAPDAAERGRLHDLAAAHGTRLDFVEADVGDAAAVAQLVADIQADPGCPLKGVFHTAGTLDDGRLLTQPAAAVRRVFAAKVAGTLNLHRATSPLALEQFVCFSSVVSCIGSPGQCAYGAANAYVDALSLQRNAEGLSGHVLNWGLWGGKGMAGQLGAAQRLQDFGLLELDPAAALQALDALSSQRQGQSAIWSVDIPVLRERSASRALGPLLGELAAGPATPGAAVRRKRMAANTAVQAAAPDAATAAPTAAKPRPQPLDTVSSEAIFGAEMESGQL